MEILNRQFGLLIAYVLPGFVTLAGVAPLTPLVAAWLRADQSAASVGAPVYALLAATAAGMVVGCVRWLLLDRLLALSGVPAPAFHARALAERPAAFAYLVESHYRYYQFYAHTLIAVAWTYLVYRWLGTSSSLSRPGTEFGVLVLCAVLFAGARDALAKYRQRSGQLIGQVASNEMDGEIMTNGIDHSQGKGGSPNPPAQPMPGAKPEAPAKPKAADPKGAKTRE